MRERERERMSQEGDAKHEIGSYTFLMYTLNLRKGPLYSLLHLILLHTLRQGGRESNWKRAKDKERESGRERERERMSQEGDTKHEIGSYTFLMYNLNLRKGPLYTLLRLILLHTLRQSGKDFFSPSLQMGLSAGTDAEVETSRVKAIRVRCILSPFDFSVLQ